MKISSYAQIPQIPTTQVTPQLNRDSLNHNNNTPSFGHLKISSSVKKELGLLDRFLLSIYSKFHSKFGNNLLDVDIDAEKVTVETGAGATSRAPGQAPNCFYSDELFVSAEFKDKNKDFVREVDMLDRPLFAPVTRFVRRVCSSKEMQATYVLDTYRNIKYFLKDNNELDSNVCEALKSKKQKLENLVDDSTYTKHGGKKFILLSKLKKSKNLNEQVKACQLINAEIEKNKKLCSKTSKIMIIRND